MVMTISVFDGTTLQEIMKNTLVGPLGRSRACGRDSGWVYN